MDKKLIAILVIAFLIRLVNLNQSLWLDEATTARVVEQYSFSEILNKFSITDFHPPLYYLFMKFWTNFFGYSEIALRMPSVMFSLVTGYLVYLLAKHFKNKETGMWAAAFFLFNPLIVYYSQEARMYLLATFLLTGSIYYLIRLNHLERASNTGKFQMIRILLVLSLFNTLALSTFYGSIFLLISLFFYLIYKRKFKLLFLLLFTVTATILLLSPLLYHQLINARLQLSLVPNWGSVLGSANIKNLLLIPLKFSIGRISFEPKWFYWLTSGLWAAMIMLFTIRGSLKNKQLAYLFIMPLVLGVLFSFFTPLLQYFRFLYLIPLFSILIASGSSTVHLKGAQWVVLTGFMLFSGVYIFNPVFHREDWKSLVKGLAKNSEVYMIASSSDPVKYYRSDIEIIDLKNLPVNISQKEIYIIPYTVDIHGVDYRKKMTQKKFRLANEKSLRGLTVEKWRR